MEVIDYNTNLINTNCGIYEIYNVENGHRYIGSSQNIHNRVLSHKQRLKRKDHKNPHLQNAWDKYGIDNFEFRTLITCPIDMLYYYEQQFLNQVKPEYNLAKCAESPNRGTKSSEETKQKISVALKIAFLDPKLREIFRKKMMGNTIWKKAKWTSSRREKSSIKMQGNEYAKGSIAWVGKKHTDETKRKMSIAKKGKHPWNYGLFDCYTEDTKQKIRTANLGKKMPDEVKAKIRNTMKEIWRRRRESQN